MNISKGELADLLIVRLNEILDCDREAVRALIEHRVPCNGGIINHDSVQASPEGVGMLGILNGLIGTIEAGPYAGWGLITAHFDDDGTLMYFKRTNEG